MFHHCMQILFVMNTVSRISISSRGIASAYFPMEHKSVCFYMEPIQIKALLCGAHSVTMKDAKAEKYNDILKS